jgi:ribonuclease P protein component
MLAYKFRFHGHGSLRFVYKNGQAIRSRLFTIKYSNNPYRKKPRFSVVVSKKVLKSAVGRNRIRRRVYEIIRQSNFIETKAVDVVIIISSSEVLTIEHEILEQQLKDALSQTDIYNP